MTNHHAVLISTISPTEFTIENLLEKPHREYRQEKFGIDDARKLIDEAHRRPDGDSDTKLLFVATNFITIEAQQALLKIIEEPPLSTKFVFALPEGFTLLPTLKSRFQVLELKIGAFDDTVFQAFCTANYAERLHLIETAVKNKDLTWQSAIKQGLKMYLTASNRTNNAATLTHLEYSQRLLLTRGASNKYLLEHIALVL